MTKVDRRMLTDGVEEPIDGEVRLDARRRILNAEVVQQIAVALAFDRDCVPKHGLEFRSIE